MRRVCLEVVDDLYRRGIDSKRFCQQLCDYFRNLLVLATGGQGAESLLDLPEDEIQVLKPNWVRPVRNPCTSFSRWS